VSPDRDALPGIDLRAAQQLALLQRLTALATEFPFPTSRAPNVRFHTDNPFFAIGDATIAFGMLRLAQPRRIVEVGGGYSSALILDMRERYLGDCEYTCAEPDPARLLELLRPGDESQFRLVPSTFDALPGEIFAALESNDVLFIDSSHVVKIGSDVSMLMFEVLPLLAPGVLVHVHDIFWPFEYPREWYAEGRAWNEAHFMRAFLMFNHGYTIEYFNDYMANRHRSVLQAQLPACMANPGGSLWLRRRR
jgi:predicted O-methyltransferase YrrM